MENNQQADNTVIESIKTKSVTYKRSEARTEILTSYTELIFIVLPFVAAGYILIQNKNWYEVIATPEWSIAAAVVYSQSLLRFIMGIIKNRMTVNWHVPQLYGAIMLVLVVLSTVNYTILKIMENPSKFYIVAQLVLFLMAAYTYMAFDGAGQVLIDKKS